MCENGCCVKSLIGTLRMMSPSWRFPSLAANPVAVISLMKIWLPSRRPYSTTKHNEKLLLFSNANMNLENHDDLDPFKYSAIPPAVNQIETENMEY